jgi:peptide/nickel transport system substrate-binding protein
VLNIATSGDPGPLDPAPVTSDLLSEITQLFYETLYIFGPDFSITPLLAAALPEMSDGGKRYVIRLRSAVPFHDGSTMNADDVVASLQRWGRLSPRGRTPWAFLDSISATDPGTIEILLKRPYSPLLNLLAFPNGSPQIIEARRHWARPAEGLHRHRAIQADRIQA